MSNSKVYGARMPDELHKAIRIAAAERDMNIQDVYIWALKDWLMNHHKSEVPSVIAYRNQLLDESHPLIPVQ